MNKNNDKIYYYGPGGVKELTERMKKHADDKKRELLEKRENIAKRLLFK